MSRPDQIKDYADHLLGGLHASEGLKGRILRDGEAALRGEKVQKRATPWQPLSPARRRAMVGRLCAAAACLLLLVGVGVTALRGSGQDTWGVTVQTAGSGEREQLQALDIPQGSITITQKANPSYRGIWASGANGNFPLVRVNGAYYRLLKNPTAIGRGLLGSVLGTVSEQTDEPALSSEGVVSNILPEGTEVYAVSGMNGAMAAAQVNGEMRVFQRVSFSGTALKKGESLHNTLRGDTAVAMELSGVGTVTDAAKARELYQMLISEATLERTGASETGTALLIQLSNGLVLQLAVRGDSVMACGTWLCPGFFEAFAEAVQ